MAIFKYKAKTQSGRIREGVVVATSKSEAGSQIKKDGLSPLFVKESKDPEGFRLLASRRISLIEKADLCRYLATMVKSGLPLMEAIEVLSSETSNPALQRILSTARASIQKGQTLSSAFSQFPEVFDEVFLTLIKVGEESGTLEKSFTYLGKQLTADYELRRKVKSTLAYPMVVVLATLALAITMLVFVVPKIAPILLRLSRDFALPSHTILILKIGVFLSDHLWLFLGVSGGVLGLAVVFLQKPTGKKVVNAFLSRLPILKQLYLALTLARFNRTLSTLLGSGVPILTALQVSSGTLTLTRYQHTKELFSSEISKGTSLAEVLKESRLFPPMMTQMVAAGEKTGALDELLFDLATFYEEEVSNSLKAITSIVEPVMMLGIGVGVGLVVISVIAPIYSFVGSLSQSLGGR